MATSESIKFIADFFLLSVTLGLVLFSPIANTKLTGNGLVKLLSNTAIGSLVISMVMQAMGWTEIVSLTFGLKTIALIGLILQTTFHKDDKSALMWIFYVAICSILFYLLGDLVQFNSINYLFILSAGGLLGIITYSMILGHWYLVVPKLSEKPLMTAAKVTWIILLIKLIWSGINFSQNHAFFDQFTQLGAGYAFNWMLLLMRVSFGYVVILGMSFFNWKLLKIRSIQSSTGILYAMTFFVFIGEMVSVYMFYNYGLFI